MNRKKKIIQKLKNKAKQANKKNLTNSKPKYVAKADRVAVEEIDAKSIDNKESLAQED